MTTTFAFNGRLEVRFDSIPSANSRAALKQHGFWWDKRAGCWYLARPVSLRYVRNEPICQDGFEYALQCCQFYLGMTNEQAEEMRKAASDDCHRAGIEGMLEANGII